MKNSNNLIILLLIVSLFKGIIWSALVPIWHIPDEQAHFAQVQYYAEMKSGIKTKMDLSQEVAHSLYLLGTYRDKTGGNKFTYHPEYRIKYSDTTTGIYEQEIKNQPFSSRINFVTKEAARYPPLFYVLSSLAYLVTYPFDLFVRLFATRLISVIFSVLLVWLSWLLARSIFVKNYLLSISIVAFVSFQPMFSFLSSGVNNDNLLNLLSTGLLWTMVDSLRYGLNTKRSMLMGSFLGLGIITKQLIYPFLPLPLFVILYEIFIYKNNKQKTIIKILPLLISVFILGGFMFIRQWIAEGSLPYWPQVNPNSPRYSYTLIEYLKDKLPQLYRETLPWYWGVFNWLGVVLPLNVLRTIKIILGIATLGFIRYVINTFKKRKLETLDWQLLLLITSSLWYLICILVWDYMLIRSIGFSHGLQGRNFFPNIAAHNVLIGVGIWNLSTKYQKQIIKFLVLAIVALNFIALKTLASSYYQLKPISSFIIQASQYKPWFYKGNLLVIWILTYIGSSLIFLYKYCIFKTTRK